MTRKDYELIAEAIKKTRKSGVTDKTRKNKVLDLLVKNLSNELKRENSKFDRNRFSEATK